MAPSQVDVSSSDDEVGNCLSELFDDEKEGDIVPELFDEERRLAPAHAASASGFTGAAYCHQLPTCELSLS
jgi:hypothetical protein